MKIAVACERFDSNAGGLEHWARQFVRGLNLRGHEVHVVTFRAGAVEDHGRPHLHVLPWSNSRFVRARAVQSVFASLKADVEHDLGTGWTADILHPQAGSGRANRRRDGASRSPSERWMQRLRPAYWKRLLELREFERRQYSRADGTIIAVSQMVARNLQELHGVSAERVRLIPNGVDTERFSPEARARLRDQTRRRLNIQPDQTLFLFAAHNPRLKGVRPLLQAMGELHRSHPEATLAIIGRDPQPEQLVDAVRLGIEDSVRFEGFVADPLIYYAAADAFVLPTFYDACSLTVLEACACGLPVITSKYNGVSELMTQGREGFLIEDPGDFEELAQAMATCTDPALRGPVSAAARALALHNSMDRNVVVIERLYEECVSRRRSENGRS